MFFFQKSYRLINLLSIDVALGACSMAYFTSYVFDISVSLLTYIILGFTVWIIYTLDHILDANSLKEKAISSRHIFHYLHQKTLIISIGFFTIVIFFLSLLYLPLSIFLYGLIAMSCVFFYIILIFFFGKKVSFLIQKELSVAIIYTFGICIPSISFLEKISFIHSVFIVECFLLAFINLCVFSYFDYQIDQKQSQTSIVRLLNEKNTIKMLKILFLTQLIIVIYYLLFIELNRSQFVLITMNSVLFLIFNNYNFFQKNEGYRLLGDSIFLYPLILFFF